MRLFLRCSPDVAGGMELMSMRECSEYQSSPGSLSSREACAVTDASLFSTMYHLSRNGARFQMFAPNQQQTMVMDHVKKQPATGENRCLNSLTALLTSSHRCILLFTHSAGIYDSFPTAAQERDGRGSSLQSRTGGDPNAGPVKAGCQQLRWDHLPWRPRHHQEPVRDRH